MANDRENIALAVDGAVYYGDVGATRPTDSTFKPSENGYIHVGYYSAEGATLTPVPGSETSILAHNEDEVVNRQAAGWWTFGLSAIEFKNPDVAEVFFDSDIDRTEGSVVVTSAAATKHYSLIAIAINEDGSQSLWHYPNAKLQERQAITFNPQSLIAGGMTFKTYRDSGQDAYTDDDGKFAHFKVFDPAWITES